MTFETKNGIACHTRGKDACTLEGRVVRFADKIAYINHDIEDAITAGILEENELPYDCVAVLGRGKNPRITTMVRSLLENSGEDIRMGPEVYRAFDALHRFMYQVVYTCLLYTSETSKISARLQSTAPLRYLLAKGFWAKREPLARML